MLLNNAVDILDRRVDKQLTLSTASVNVHITDLDVESRGVSQNDSVYYRN